jgi:N-acetylmuramoyl-L-alanine amidase
MPSVLIETGFISNASEANYLKSEQGQDAIALSIFEAFKKFKARNYGPGATTVAQTRPEKSITEKPIEKEALPSPKIVEKEVPETSVPGKFNVENNEVKAQAADTIATDQEIFYSVQIAAGTVSVEPVPANFKGLKNVRREKSDKYFRFYVGKESSMESAASLLQQIAVKFPQAFIVSFVNGNRVIINNNPK